MPSFPPSEGRFCSFAPSFSLHQGNHTRPELKTQQRKILFRQYAKCNKNLPASALCPTRPTWHMAWQRPRQGRALLLVRKAGARGPAQPITDIDAQHLLLLLYCTWYIQYCSTVVSTTNNCCIQLQQHRRSSSNNVNQGLHWRCTCAAKPLILISHGCGREIPTSQVPSQVIEDHNRPP